MFTAKLRDPLALIVLLAAAGRCWPAALGHTFMPEENLRVRALQPDRALLREPEDACPTTT